MTRRGNQIKRIFIHCTAGYAGLDGLKKHWQSLGWKSPGYHLLVDLEGHIIVVQPFSKPSNGVKGYNADSIHISYIGGVDPKNVFKAIDTRNTKQKASIIEAIKLAIKWIEETGGSKKQLQILGHRDISPDTNNDGIIASWERIKECPSFDAIPEYKHLLR